MKKQASKKNRMTLILLLAVLLAGLSLLLYPMVADYWNSMHQPSPLPPTRRPWRKWTMNLRNPVAGGGGL